MPDILKPEKGSRDNILRFLDSIQDIEIKELLLSNLEHILAVGSDKDQGKLHRQTFLQAVEALIEVRTQKGI